MPRNLKLLVQRRLHASIPEGDLTREDLVRHFADALRDLPVVILDVTLLHRECVVRWQGHHGLPPEDMSISRPAGELARAN